MSCDGSDPRGLGYSTSTPTLLPKSLFAGFIVDSGFVSSQLLTAKAGLAVYFQHLSIVLVSFCWCDREGGPTTLDNPPRTGMRP